MKTRLVKIRYKLIFAYLASLLLAGMSMFFLVILFIGLYYKRVNELSRWVSSHAMAIPFIFLSVVCVFFILMSMFFLLLTNRGTKYLEDITKSIQEIAQGNLEICIPLRTTDELGELAGSVNHMAYKLKVLLEEERNWERTKNELINNVSHDLRTPLTSVLGYLELINTQVYADKAELQRYIGVVYTKCNSLKQLIDDLFEYSKLSSKESVINKTKVNLGELLEQIMIGFMPMLNEMTIEYRLFFENSKMIVNADPVLLVRLFENLISNAIHYGKEGKYIDIELAKEENDAVVRVANYGETIPEQDLPYIFERLYQVDKSRSRQNGGSGLGLAIVRSIVEIHSGEVTVSSRDNKTVFAVRLKVV